MQQANKSCAQAAKGGQVLAVLCSPASAAAGPQHRGTGALLPTAVTGARSPLSSMRQQGTRHAALATTIYYVCSRRSSRRSPLPLLANDGSTVNHSGTQAGPHAGRRLQTAL